MKTLKTSWQKPAALLLCLLVASALLLAATGLVLKHTIGRSSEQLQGTMAIAVPFVLLRGDIPLDATKDPVPEQTPNSGQDTPPPGVGQETTPPSEEGGDDQQTNAIVPVQEPQWGPVEESYFDNVLFIGDSRTVGLSIYGRLGKAHYFCDVGMNLFNLFDKTISDGENFKNQTLRGLLQSKPYTHVYVMLGINEIGYSASSLVKKLTALVMEIQSLQPETKIVLMANLTVSQKKAQKNPVFALDKVQGLNNMIASYADNKRIFYLDSNPALADANGYLRSDATGDGVHPYAAEYKNWSIWIKEHALLPAEAT